MLLQLAAAHAGAGAGQLGGGEGGDDGGAVAQLRVLRVHVLHAEPRPLPQLVPHHPAPPPEVRTLPPQVERVDLVLVVPPAHQLRHVRQPDGRRGRARAHALAHGVGAGRAGRGRGGAGGRVRGRARVLHGGEGVVRGDRAGRLQHLPRPQLHPRPAPVAGGHEVVQLRGRRAHAVAPQPQRVHVGQLYLRGGHLQRLQVELPDVEALAGCLHHGVGHEPLQPAHLPAHVGVHGAGPLLLLAPPPEMCLLGTLVLELVRGRLVTNTAETG